MLSGYPPFEGDDEKEMSKNILNLKFDFEDEIWDEISVAAKELISKMLTIESERITPKEVLNDEWMQHPHSIDTKINAKMLERLNNFQNVNRFKKTIYSYLASKASYEEMKDEIKFFNSIDTNKDGYITLKELKKGLKDVEGGNFCDIDDIVKQIDTDNNGAINFNEFLAATLSASISKDCAKISKAFKFFDKNNDGYINDKELKAIMAGSEFKHIETKIFSDVINE